MMSLESEIARLQRRIDTLKARRTKAPRLVERSGTSKRGRPKISAVKIMAAKRLVETNSIADVALSLGVGRTTLFAHGIKRYRFPRKAETAKA